LMRLGLVLAAIAIAVLVALAALYYTAPSERVIRIATTTSLYATGLLDALAGEYRKLHPGVTVHVIPVGTGEALRRAAMGDADVVFVHAPSLEAEYIRRGVLVGGGIVAYNYFVIVGPPEDPAGIRGLGDAVEAFRRIYAAGLEGRAAFVSRGDNSGTHDRELMLWRLAGLKPGGSWYIETGSGMAETLIVANERRAYTLTDEGTYLKLKAEGRLPNLMELVTGSEELINVYSVYVVNSELIGKERYGLARDFVAFVLDPRGGLRVIASFGLEEFGRPLFMPATGSAVGWLREVWERLAGGA